MVSKKSSPQLVKQVPATDKNSKTRKKVSPEIYALSTIMFVVILSIILLSNAMESREYRKDQRALRGGDAV